MKDIKANLTPYVYLTSKNNLVVEVSQGFKKLFGYEDQELLGKSLDEISHMLKMDSQILMGDIKKDTQLYCFTKQLQVQQVTISPNILDHLNKQEFIFTWQEDNFIEDQFNFARQLQTNRKTEVMILSMPDLLVLKSSSGFFKYYNPPYDQGNVLGKRLKEIAPQYIYDRLYSRSQRISQSHKPYYISEGYPIDHEMRYWDSSTVPIFQNGKVAYVIHSASDITQQITSEQVVKQKNRELETIIENVFEAIILVDKNGKLLQANKMAKASPLYDVALANNMTIEEFCNGMDMLDLRGNLVPMEDRPGAKIMGHEAFPAKRFVIKTDIGVLYREISGIPILNSQGEFQVGLIISKDIASDLEKEENLLIKTQHDILYRMIENLELGLVRFSYPSLKIVDMNHKFFYNFKDRKQLMKKLSDGIETGYQSQYKTKQMTIDYEGRYFKFIYQPLFKLDGKPKEILVIAIEITEEIARQNQLKKILELQEEVFVNISHEFRTPVNVIFSMCQLLELYLKDESQEVPREKMLGKIHKIKQNCNRFTKIINNVIDVSQMGSGELQLQLENQDIVDLVRQVIKSVKDYIPDKRFELAFQTNVEELLMAIDPFQIKRVIMNLISNAFKFSSDGDLVTVTLRQEEDMVEISVSDQGIGIEEKYFKAIFNQFAQVDKSLMRQAEGSGIGLSLVKAIVALHNGEVSVTSESGKGSTFKIKLPVVAVADSKKLTDFTDPYTYGELLNIEFSDLY